MSVDTEPDAVPDADEQAPGEPEAERPESRPGLSPSRANDFAQCPLLFRYRSVDRLPEPASRAAARGTLVHAVLERLFDLPAPERTEAAARQMVPGAWRELRERSSAYDELFAGGGLAGTGETGAADGVDAAVETGAGGTDEVGVPSAVVTTGGDASGGEDEAAWLASAEDLIATYFTLEDPTRLEPRARELSVRLDLEDGPQLRGIVDRVDVAPNGWVRIVDYKTGRSPRPGYEAHALFQMRFYAYVIWRTRGMLPRALQLEYLGDGQVIRHEPTESEMHTLEARVRSLWASVQGAARSGEWQARPSALCGWCSFQALCPAFGGTPPRIDPDAVERAVGVRPDQA